MNSNGIVSAFVKMFASRRTLPLWLMMLAASFVMLLAINLLHWRSRRYSEVR